MKRRDFCKALVCSAALAPGLVLPRAEAAAKSQTVGRAVPAGNYTMSFRSELSQMDIEHEYYYSDSFFAHASIQYDHQLALATLGMVTAAFNTWASDAKYWANGDVGRENSLDAAYTKLGFGDVKYRYYDVDVGRGRRDRFCLQRACRQGPGPQQRERAGHHGGGLNVLLP